MDAHAPIGRIYVPTVVIRRDDRLGDCRPTSSRSSTALDGQPPRSNRPEPRFLRGALWRNFQARYREINDLHKQMLRVSAAVEAMPAGALRDRARDHLLPRPVERLLLARLVRRHVHRAHAHGHAGRADRGRRSRAGRARHR